MSKRVGKWSWSLTGKERLAAAAVTRARSEGARLSAKLKLAYAAMIEKQRKLLARGDGAGRRYPRVGQRAEPLHDAMLDRLSRPHPSGPTGDDASRARPLDHVRGI